MEEALGKKYCLIEQPNLVASTKHNHIPKQIKVKLRSTISLKKISHMITPVHLNIV